MANSKQAVPFVDHSTKIKFRDGWNILKIKHFFIIINVLIMLTRFCSELSRQTWLEAKVNELVHISIKLTLQSVSLNVI
jgi:hypothetical protein